MACTFHGLTPPRFHGRWTFARTDGGLGWYPLNADIPVTSFDSNLSESDPQLHSSHLVPLFEGIVSSLSYYWFSSCLGRAVGIVPPFPAWRSDLPSSDSWLITNIWWVSVDQNGLTVLKCGIFNLFSAVVLSWILPSCGHCPEGLTTLFQGVRIKL